MKKLVILLLCAMLTVICLSSCEAIDYFVDNIYGGQIDSEQSGGNILDDEIIDSEEEEENQKPDNTPNSQYTYTDFTTTEKNLFIKYIGEVIPFAPTNEYYVEGYYDVDDYENGMNFYTVGNTEKDFKEYLKLYSSYTLEETYSDSYGDTWYCYTKGDIVVDLSFYKYEGDYYIDVFVFSYASDDNGGNSGNGGNGGTTDGYTYTDFTDSEKQILINYFGAVFPFIANSEYYLEEYTYDYGDSYEEGYNFYTIGNTQAEFNAYKTLFSAYTYEGSEVDSYGDTWYYYSFVNGSYLDISYYSDGQVYYVDVYCYFLYENDDGGNGGNGDNGGNSGSTDDYDVITNEGAGLPIAGDVYDVDFTKGQYVQNVTDQGYYIDGCPTTGSPAVLVIPVEFSDVSAKSKGYSITNIISAFNGPDSAVDYYSVKSYYAISSSGDLNIEFTILDEWFCPMNKSSYYKNATTDYYGSTLFIGDQMILNEALDYLDDLMDLSKFDSDGNGTIDAVILVNTLNIDSESDFNWAYRYWNMYTDDYGNYYEYDGVSANDYIWASYGFMHESYDESGEVSYTDTSVMNTYTFIHEFAHVLGLEDYYDTAYKTDPMNGCDIMDIMTGDHNPFSKIELGWITESRLVTTSNSVTLTLDAFSKSGDTIIISNNFDPKLGAYQEYYIIMYYTMDGLNGGDYGYFEREGILVYHVNASLYKEEIDGEIQYDIYNNNTDASDEYGTVNNLIEFVLSAEGNYTYVEGDKPPKITDDLGDRLSYTFTIDSLDGDVATITFTKN